MRRQTWSMVGIMGTVGARCSCRVVRRSMPALRGSWSNNRSSSAMGGSMRSLQDRPCLDCADDEGH